MTFCHAARKGGYNGSHWPKHVRASALLDVKEIFAERDEVFGPRWQAQRDTAFEMLRPARRKAAWCCASRRSPQRFGRGSASPCLCVWPGWSTNRISREGTRPPMSTDGHRWKYRWRSSPLGRRGTEAETPVNPCPSWPSVVELLFLGLHSKPPVQSSGSTIHSGEPPRAQGTQRKWGHLSRRRPQRCGPVRRDSKAGQGRPRHGDRLREDQAEERAAAGRIDWEAHLVRRGRTGDGAPVGAEADG